MSSEQRSDENLIKPCTSQSSQSNPCDPQTSHHEPTSEIGPLQSETCLPTHQPNTILPSAPPSSTFEELSHSPEPKPSEPGPSALTAATSQPSVPLHIKLRCSGVAQPQSARLHSIDVGPDPTNPFIFPNSGREGGHCPRQLDVHSRCCSRAQAKHSGSSSRSLIFPQRIRNIPTVRILRKVYSNVRGSNSLLGCLVAAGEVAALAAAAPAAAAWHILPFVAETPLHVADLLLCKGLDMAERALPCLTQTPLQACEGVVFCACGVPLGLAYVACKGCCVGARLCACDAPAACVGAPALAACALAEFALCDAPAALCRLPARLTAAAAREAARDVRAWLRAVDICAGRFLRVFRDEEGDDLRDEDGDDFATDAERRV